MKHKRWAAIALCFPSSAFVYAFVISSIDKTCVGFLFCLSLIPSLSFLRALTGGTLEAIWIISSFRIGFAKSQKCFHKSSFFFLPLKASRHKRRDDGRAKNNGSDYNILQPQFFIPVSQFKYALRSSNKLKLDYYLIASSFLLDAWEKSFCLLQSSFTLDVDWNELLILPSHYVSLLDFTMQCFAVNKRVLRENERIWNSESDQSCGTIWKCWQGKAYGKNLRHNTYHGLPCILRSNLCQLNDHKVNAYWLKTIHRIFN